MTNKELKEEYTEWTLEEWISAMEEISNENENERYIQSSTNGDYSPSNPWEAPAMSIRDFI